MEFFVIRNNSLEVEHDIILKLQEGNSDHVFTRSFELGKLRAQRTGKPLYKVTIEVEEVK